MKVLVVVFCIATLVFPVHIAARSLDEIQQEIDAQNQSLSDVQKQLLQAEKNLKNIEGSINSAQGEIPRLEAEIKQIQAQIELNKLQIQQSTETQKLKELEQEDRETRQVKAIKSAYQTWRQQNGVDTTIIYGTEGGMKHEVYQAEVSGKELSSIEALIAQVNKIKEDLANLEKQTGTLEEQNAQLAQRKQELQARVVALQTSRYSASGAVAGLQGQVTVLKSKISQLSAEQKALQDYTYWILGQSGNGGTKTIDSGLYYFTGRGNDSYAYGHGVGMSQWGAYGAANAGWNASQILSFYYKDTHIESRTGTINVSGYGVMDLNDYAAGQGEVPSHACGTAEQVAARPDKYATSNCWPEEAIKAQVIAFRSYAYSLYAIKGKAICTDEYCQAYMKNGNGATSTQWAAYETRDQVIVSHGYTQPGQVIEAYYSGDNNNGWGSADNDTVWSGRDGSGTPYSYLRAVKDNDFAVHINFNQNANWTWRTNGYTLNPVLKSDGTYTANSFRSMLEATIQNQRLSQESRNFVAEIYNSVGEIASIELVRDNADIGSRVKLVKFVGKNGVVRKMASWYFQTIWTYWVNDRVPTGQVDPMYSQTFYLLRQ